MTELVPVWNETSPMSDYKIYYFPFFDKIEGFGIYAIIESFKFTMQYIFMGIYTRRACYNQFGGEYLLYDCLQLTYENMKEQKPSFVNEDIKKQFLYDQIAAYDKSFIQSYFDSLIVDPIIKPITEQTGYLVSNALNFTSSAIGFGTSVMDFSTKSVEKITSTTETIIDAPKSVLTVLTDPYILVGLIIIFIVIKA